MNRKQHPATFFSQAAENNKQAILAQLLPWLKHHHSILEIGSGTGQHAAHFAAACPHLIWQCSDLQPNLAAINYWRQHMQLTQQPKPLSYQVGEDSWPCDVDAVYTANTAHIMTERVVKTMYLAIGQYLPEQGHFFHYGPFKQAAEYSSESNRAFDRQLLQAGYGGLRDLEQLQQWASTVAMTLRQKIEMPSHNLLLIWQKKTNHQPI
ncbi:DUF938 domain-containing protein [Agarivorans sp. Z349TD_8]|uniref:DUF938 domain-containing protein n=1 Tax=Agarivorans sp. Z349TD_8 TaxID=3421434 RepID=UPI003D7D53AB